MKKHLIASALTVLLVAGCGSNDSTPKTTPQAPKPPKPPAADNAQPNTPAPDAGQAPATPPAPAPAPGATAPTAAPAADANDPLKNYRTDNTGASFSEVQILQRLADNYNRLQPSSKTEPGKPGWPPLTDLQQLVTVGMLKELPQAPNGQKFKYDVKTGKVSVGN